MEKYIKRAEILIEALPYIQYLSKKIIVIKYGGNAMLTEELKDKVMSDISLLKYIGINPILVHGGGPDIDEALSRNGIESKFINGNRVTDEKVMEIAQMVLAGKVNKQIVSKLNTKGVKSIGLCGIDAKIITCRKSSPSENYESCGEVTDMGFVGQDISVDSELLLKLCRDIYVPVVAPIGVDENGQSYNINADIVASEIASSLKAEKLILLTDIDGVRKNIDSPEIYYEISQKEVYSLIDDGVISGGMIPKVLGCISAINKGVNRVHIIDGRIPHSLLLEIFTDTGIGTMICP